MVSLIKKRCARYDVSDFPAWIAARGRELVLPLNAATVPRLAHPARCHAEEARVEGTCGGGARGALGDAVPVQSTGSTRIPPPPLLCLQARISMTWGDYVSFPLRFSDCLERA